MVKAVHLTFYPLRAPRTHGMASNTPVTPDTTSGPAIGSHHGILLLRLGGSELALGGRAAWSE